MQKPQELLKKYFGYDYDNVNETKGDFNLIGFEGSEYWVQVRVLADRIINGKDVVEEIKVRPIKIKIKETIPNGMYLLVAL